MSNEQSSEYMSVHVGSYKVTHIVAGSLGFVLGMILAIIFFGIGASIG